MSLATSSMGTNTWPPPSLMDDTDNILAECENLEVSGADDASILVLQMACLLFQRNYIAARHLWRRYKDTPMQQTLQPWWKVGACALSGHVTSTWQALHELHTQVADTALYASYAREIALSYREYYLKGLQLLERDTIPSYAPAVLGFSSQEELQEYLASQQAAKQTKAVVPEPVRTDLVAFLESRWTI